MSTMQEARLTTGIAGLDVLLDGGLVAGAVHLVMGRPGTGKTTLGNQICFAHAAAGRRAVYVTLLAETHARMLRNLASLDFFDPNLVGSFVSYVGAYLVLREKRLRGLLQMLRRVLADERPALLVIDGISSASSVGESEISFKEFLAELQVLGDMSETTTILLGTMTADEAVAPEHSMVDGLIELTLRRSAQRTVREIEVLKLRGTSHFLGGHDLELSSRGIIVRPRTELLLSKTLKPAPRTEGRRRSTGVPNFDAMLEGGFLSGSATMLLGFSGSGKTLLTLHFLDAGARLGEPSLYFGFYESPGRLLEAGERVGLSLLQHVESQALRVEWQPPLKHGLDAIAEQILDDVRARGVRRLVIDGLDGLRQNAAYPERTIRFITALFNELRSLDVTVLITEETQKIFGPEVEVRVEGMSALVDNIVLLEYLDVGSSLRRLLSIVKQRGGVHETSIRELCITNDGVSLAEDGTSASHILRDLWDLGRNITTRGNETASRRGSRKSPR